MEVPELNEQLNYKLQGGRFINQAIQEVEDIIFIPDWIKNFLQIEWF
ncbi:hypothetical protein GFC29_1342 [Anoxybacillus sp. B7M1]|nr:hypothetical protein GFC28_282 [Anoxybacillus sp. B2M1]ANB64030.1 hypothetical protein GFC29_1342 [Anoxybacillus sp. B7M1]